MKSPPHLRAKGARILVACCAFWAFSFPIMKALEQVGRSKVPHASSLFLASLGVSVRFGLATLILAGFILPRLRQLNRLELTQGIGLGILGAIGLVLQMDAMSYTQASTCAFLTQGYCVWLPIWFAFRDRRLPSVTVLAATGMVLLGGAVLAGVDLKHLRLGRGEWETLAGSVAFAGQILWLERPQFRGNDVLRFSTVMFATLSLLSLPLALITAGESGYWVETYASPAAGILFLILILVCTLFTFTLANRWQPEVSATEAGLLYSTEPVFTAAISLFLPELISRWTGIQYPNEQLSPNLLIGGGMILCAVVLLQLPSLSKNSESPE